MTFYLSIYIYLSISLPTSQIIFQIFILMITYAQSGRHYYHHFTSEKNQSLENKNTSFHSQLVKIRVELGPNPLMIPRVPSAVPRIEIPQGGVAETSTPPSLTIFVSRVVPRRQAPAQADFL